ncbi:ABC-2 type transport system permease protein [Thermosporothrix hazakensis]|jgi:ABC-2 type transport system permease protein|uniref:Transport permease protein n=1 Tax=Thermosporothrix hazakensis TaxID=644383 RepID=A0A326U451_THEHA|nr:ABC transporter permease [Thermosporothrix hazakensis]PZW27404.1 ABC-2 type transport system permease protein [Thermosporothrix hazakensis]GCE45571.1 hypothetical protein KTH_04400 [Thermosporothrix hazakensis]
MSQPESSLPRIYKRPSLLTQLFDIFLIELTNWRWSWRGMLITGTIAPLFSLLALSIFARDSGPYSLSYVLVGNIVFSLLFNTMDNISSHVLFMRRLGMLDYFGTLPIWRPILIFAILLAFLLLALPSLVVMIVLGSLILNLPLHISPLVVLVVPLCAVPLAGIGAIIGSRIRSPQEASAISIVLIFLLSALGPVVIPPERLPSLFNLLGRLSPATYASSALRQVLLGPITGQLAIDIGVLIGFSLILTLIASRLIAWKEQ